MRMPYSHQKPLFSQWSNHRISKELQVVDRILSDLPEIVKWVAADLAGGSLSEAGARGMTAEQVLRAAILKQQNRWTYEELELQCVDSAMTKAFMRLDIEESYSKSCLQSNVSKIKASTWQKINDHMVQYAADLGVEKGRTVRFDATVVESNIHHPTDSGLLYDCIRVVGHVLKRLRKKTNKRWYSPCLRKNAKRELLSIINAKDNRVRKHHYRRLLKEAKALKRALPSLIEQIDRHFNGESETKRINLLKKVSSLLPRIIKQTEDRVIYGRSVPSEEKIVSIFEEHTDIIVKGRRDLEFGHKVFLSAGSSGLVTDCQLVQGNAADAPFFMDLVERQIDIYGRPPRQTTADGGFASLENVEEAKDIGVSDVCFSKRCGLKIEEMVKSKWVFEKLRNLRTGIEGIISVLKRGFGFDRVSWKGVSGFASYVHSSVVAYNLSMLARLIE